LKTESFVSPLSIK